MHSIFLYFFAAVAAAAEDESSKSKGTQECCVKLRDDDDSDFSKAEGFEFVTVEPQGFTDLSLKDLGEKFSTWWHDGKVAKCPKNMVFVEKSCKDLTNDQAGTKALLMEKFTTQCCFHLKIRDDKVKLDTKENVFAPTCPSGKIDDNNNVDPEPITESCIKMDEDGEAKCVIAEPTDDCDEAQKERALERSGLPVCLEITFDLNGKQACIKQNPEADEGVMCIIVEATDDCSTQEMQETVEANPNWAPRCIECDSESKFDWWGLSPSNCKVQGSGHQCHEDRMWYILPYNNCLPTVPEKEVEEEAEKEKETGEAARRMLAQASGKKTGPVNPKEEVNYQIALKDKPCPSDVDEASQLVHEDREKHDPNAATSFNIMSAAICVTLVALF